MSQEGRAQPWAEGEEGTGAAPRAGAAAEALGASWGPQASGEALTGEGMVRIVLPGSRATGEAGLRGCLGETRKALGTGDDGGMREQWGETPQPLRAPTPNQKRSCVEWARARGESEVNRRHSDTQ